MTTIFQNCRLIDGVSGDARDGCDVIIEGDQIVAVEETRAWSESEHNLIPAAGFTLLPGLIDCHAHYTIDPREPNPFGTAQRESDALTILRAARNAREALEAGVTTTREAGAPRQLNFALRDAIAAGLIPGPRILAPGCAITITGGHGMMFGVEADGIDALQTAVRTQMRDGADVVKIVSSEAAMLTSGAAACEELTQAELDMLVYEAHRRGLKIFSHAQSAASVVRSARAGVEIINELRFSHW